MQNIYKTLNNVPSHLLTWDNPFDCDGKDVIVCISGNPGLTEFYIDFGTELHALTGLPICVIGQAGHESVPNHETYVLKTNEHLFNLEGQLAHKLDLIKNLDKRSKLHLMGHSIGAWLLIELLDKHSQVTDRVSSVNLLFPTVQKMAESPNGKVLTNFTKRIHYIILLLVAFVQILPHAVVSFLVSVFSKFSSYPACYNERIINFLKPDVVEKTLFLAYDEMDLVVNLNKNGFEKVKSVTNVIYSDRDGWVPVQYMDDLKQFEPEIKMKLVTIEHTFVMKSSERVAELVADFLKTKV